MHGSAAARGFQRMGGCPLPVFRSAQNGRAVFYAPRLAVVVSERHVPQVAHMLETLAPGAAVRPIPASPPLQPLGDAVKRLARAAQAANDAADAAADRPFVLECLTLFLNNACNLNCRYCYTAASGAAEARITPGAVRAAAGLVAGDCTRAGLPLTVAFHGGGEPTLDQQYLKELLAVAQAVAEDHRVPLRTYLATNGVMPEEHARWVARKFDLIGLSCDGPPHIHDRQRPARDGAPTSSRVDRTAAILRSLGSPYHVRVTLTPDTFDEQADIVEYIVSRHAPAEIRMEPVYVNPSGTETPARDDAARFAAGFMAARRIALSRGARVSTSLTRPGSLYGRYCNVLRGVLNLAPGDVATGCFLESRDDGIARRQVGLGRMSADSGRFELDEGRIGSMTGRCVAAPHACRDCLCVRQCTYGCPDVCVLSDSAGGGESFRCQANRLLMTDLILDAADRAWDAAQCGEFHDAWDPQTLLEVLVCRERAGEAAT